jgi:hypothetical protein
VACARITASAESGKHRLRHLGSPFGDREHRPGPGEHGGGCDRQHTGELVADAAPSARIWHLAQQFQQPTAISSANLDLDARGGT